MKANSTFSVALVMLPVVMIEGIAGGYIGYNIYRRVEELVE
jgi:hypothetical protein